LAPITTNKAHLPDTFSGTNPDKLKTFLFQCQLYFWSNPNHFSREQAKVDFAMTFFTGIALSWFESAIDQEDAGVVLPWSTNFTLFATELHLHFGISDPKGEAAKAIKNLSYCSGRSEKPTMLCGMIPLFRNFAMLSRTSLEIPLWQQMLKISSHHGFHLGCSLHLIGKTLIGK
jgi:hypothetical protein